MRTLTDGLILLALATLVHGRSLTRVAREPARAGAGERQVILVVADGLRWQEVFRGADSSILFSKAGDDEARRRYWRASAAERRAALMPFLWSTVASRGQLVGDRDIGSASRVTNDQWFSYPGYNEMLVGYPDARINSNLVGPNPNVTVFEWLQRDRALRGRIAVFGMWDTFEDIFNVRRSGLPVQHFETDAGTQSAALRHLERVAPGALFVGFGATDDLAHKGRYDRVLDAAHDIDHYVAELWAAAQRSPATRGRTTLIVVADHGRGRTVRDWTDHGRKVEGSDETWMAILGPDIPAAGERRVSITLAQTAATVAASLGRDYRHAVPRAAPAYFGQSQTKTAAVVAP